MNAVPPPPPNDVRLKKGTADHLTFSWSGASFNCSMLHYRIVASNCGLCPEMTRNTTATCRGNYRQLTNDAPCSFAVQTLVCGNTAGDLSLAVNVIWRDVTSTRTTENEHHPLSTETEVNQCT